MSKKIPRVVVGVLIYNDKNEVLLVSSPKWKDKWTVPGGHLEWGETLESCVKREIKEELNLAISNILFLGVQEGVLTGEFAQERHFIYMDYCAKAVTKDIILNEELSAYKWFSVADALKDSQLKPSMKVLIERFIKARKL